MDAYRVEEMWRVFADIVMPAGGDFSDIQRSETRKAFYAGCLSMLLFTRDVVGSPEVPEEQGVEVLERMLAECETFCRDAAREGKA